MIDFDMKDDKHIVYTIELEHARAQRLYNNTDSGDVLVELVDGQVMEGKCCSNPAIYVFAAHPKLPSPMQSYLHTRMSNMNKIF